MQRVLVEGARASQLGVADSAGMGSVSQRQLEARTIYRPGELLEAVPGLAASQHSGEGKANQFYLRGFNLDHGTDLRTSVDGMPVNQRSHAHGQGWTDLNFIIPELVARLDYSKGPYNAATGDFSSAGAAAINVASRLPRDQASATAGQDGYGRALLAVTRDAGGNNGADGGDRGDLGRPAAWLYALEAVHNDGPFTRGDNYRKLNAVLRYSSGFANNGYTLTAMAYRGAWNATDQIPQRAVDSGMLGRFDAIDPTDGGQARRYSLSAAWTRSDESGTTRANAYIINNRLQLFSNFTYFLDDPLHGDQFAQPDRRVTSGFEASRSWHGHTDDMAWSATLGLQAQNDNIFNALQHTEARQVLATVRADHIVETSAAAYFQQRLRLTPWLRGEAGLRLDRYRFAVGDSGRADASLASPGISLAFGPWSRTEFYVNAGRGFHSNDARGVTQARGPATPLARSSGLEIGLRSEAVKGLQSVLTLYRLDFDSELVYLGDAGSTEAGSPSRRYGIEFSNYYKPAKWLSLDADLAFAHGRFRPAVPAPSAASGTRIPGAIEGVAQLAATLTPAGSWSGSLRLRWFGPRPLVEDNTVRSRSSATLNGRLAYKLAPRTALELEGFNLANRQVAAIDYYYASRLKGEAAANQDIHFHPVESRAFRLSVTHAFSLQ